MSGTSACQAPKVFYVNWFRKTADGKWLWPGYGENSRVLEWMCQRVDGTAGGVKTPIGYLPNETDLNLAGLELPAEDLRELLRVDIAAWQAEVPDIEKHFAQFGDRLPERLRAQVGALRERLGE